MNSRGRIRRTRKRGILMDLTELNLTDVQLEGVNSYLQSQGDKIRTDYSKRLKDLEGKLPVEPTEEEKAYQEKIKALEDREKALNKKEFTTNLQGKLKDKGLNEQLAAYLNVDGVEDLETYIGDIAKVIGGQLEGYKPKDHERKSSKTTKAEFKKMGYIDRMNLYNTNKELYDTLNK